MVCIEVSLKGFFYIIKRIPNALMQVSAGSTTCAQFSAIYPVMVVPSVYFIGRWSKLIALINMSKLSIRFNYWS